MFPALCTAEPLPTSMQSREWLNVSMRGVVKPRGRQGAVAPASECPLLLRTPWQGSVVGSTSLRSV